MEVSLDRVQLFERFLAESDLRSSFRPGGECFSGPRAHLERGLNKILDPLQDCLEDAVLARQILLEFGYGSEQMPLSMMVNDLIARVVENADPGLSEETDEAPEIVGISVVDTMTKDQIFDQILRTPATKEGDPI